MRREFSVSKIEDGECVPLVFLQQTSENQAKTNRSVKTVRFFGGWNFAVIAQSPFFSVKLIFLVYEEHPKKKVTCCI